MMDKFSEWLARETDISDKGRRDIVSRAKRVSGFIDINKVKSDDEARYLLSQKVEFSGLSTTVRSQLRRSVHYYLLFRDKKKP